MAPPAIPSTHRSLAAGAQPSQGCPGLAGPLVGWVARSPNAVEGRGGRPPPGPTLVLPALRAQLGMSTRDVPRRDRPNCVFSQVTAQPLAEERVRGGTLQCTPVSSVVASINTHQISIPHSTEYSVPSTPNCPCMYSVLYSLIAEATHTALPIRACTYTGWNGGARGVLAAAQNDTRAAGPARSSASPSDWNDGRWLDAAPCMRMQRHTVAASSAFRSLPAHSPPPPRWVERSSCSSKAAGAPSPSMPLLLESASVCKVEEGGGQGGRHWQQPLLTGVGALRKRSGNGRTQGNAAPHPPTPRYHGARRQSPVGCISPGEGPAGVEYPRRPVRRGCTRKYMYRRASTVRQVDVLYNTCSKYYAVQHRFFSRQKLLPSPPTLGRCLPGDSDRRLHFHFLHLDKGTHCLGMVGISMRSVLAPYWPGERRHGVQLDRVQPTPGHITGTQQQRNGYWVPSSLARELSYDDDDDDDDDDDEYVGESCA
ncbi:hypothetical protein RJ55_02803 [Drechmeria coniospora]|nr:hypothetical protein RJ55_02803 [Drechmeria coniospora]